MVRRYSCLEKCETISVPILSDTKYHPELHLDYNQCNVILAHIGSLLDRNVYAKESQYVCEDDGSTQCPSTKDLANYLCEKNHLYLPGLTRFLCDCLPTDMMKAKPRAASWLNRWRG